MSRNTTKTPEELREAKRLVCQKWRQNNPDRVKELGQKHDAKRQQEKREYNHAYHQSHKEEICRRQRERAARKQADGTRKRDLVKERGYCKKWKSKNRDRIAEYNAKYLPQWHKDNPNWWKQYYENNRDSVLARAQVQRAIRKGASGKFTASEVKQLFEKQKGLCAYFSVCGNKITQSGPSKYRVDHIEPLQPKDKSRPPGTNDPSNIQLTCDQCNSFKRAKDPYAFTQAYEGRLFPDLPQVPKKR